MIARKTLYAIAEPALLTEIDFIGEIKLTAFSELMLRYPIRARYIQALMYYPFTLKKRFVAGSAIAPDLNEVASRIAWVLSDAVNLRRLNLGIEHTMLNRSDVLWVALGRCENLTSLRLSGLDVAKSYRTYMAGILATLHMLRSPLRVLVLEKRQTVRHDGICLLELLLFCKETLEELRMRRINLWDRNCPDTFFPQVRTISLRGGSVRAGPSCRVWLRSSSSGTTPAKTRMSKGPLFILSLHCAKAGSVARL